MRRREWPVACSPVPTKGKAAWQVVAGRLVIAYEHPDGDDPLAARIVTIWRRR